MEEVLEEPETANQLLRDLRKGMGLTQLDMAGRMKMTRVGVYLLEQRETLAFSTFLDYLQALGASEIRVVFTIAENEYTFRP